MTFRTLTVFAFALTAASASAELLTIRWSDAGRYDGTMVVEAGKFAEACGPLKQGQTIRWKFAANHPLDFNIHYHEGKKVVYPERRDAVASLEGELRVALDQDYCWMWENKGAARAEVRLSLNR
jgi:hypothetical protein